MKNVANVKMYFDSNPKCDVLYFTSDDSAFFQFSDAMNAAKLLNDKKVETITRAELVVELAKPAEDQSKDAKVPPATPLEAAKMALDEAIASRDKLPKNALKEKKEAAAQAVIDAEKAYEAALLAR